MRIAFITEPWGSIGPAGASTSISIVTARLAARLADRASIVVYSAKKSGRPEIEHDAAGVEYRRVRVVPDRYIHRIMVDLEPDFDRGWTRLPYWAQSGYYRGYARRIARDLLSQSVDIVHVHSFSQFVPVIRALHPQARIVLHLHTDQLSLLDRDSMIERLREVDLVLGPSEHTVRRLRERFPEFAERCQILYNGVNAERFVPRPDLPDRAESDVLRCLFVGRVTPEKGLHVLLDGFAQLRADVPKARLDVYGANAPMPFNSFSGLSPDPAMAGLKRYYSGSPLSRLKSTLVGRRREYFRALEQRHGKQFGGSIIFHGAVSHEDLPQVYPEADLLIMPSVCHEAFSLPVMEAMACGVPFVATRAGGIVEDAGRAGAGLIVERNDPAALAAAMRELAFDPERRADMGRKGREFARRSVFSWDRIADALWACYEGLTRRSRGQMAA